MSNSQQDPLKTRFLQIDGRTFSQTQLQDAAVKVLLIAESSHYGMLAKVFDTPVLHQVEPSRHLTQLPPWISLPDLVVKSRLNMLVSHLQVSFARSLLSTSSVPSVEDSAVACAVCVGSTDNLVSILRPGMGKKF